MSKKGDFTGTKFLIAAGALAGMIGGWILLSVSGSMGAGGNKTVRDQAVVDLLTRPLPTLAQPNDWSFPVGSVADPASLSQPTPIPTLRSVDAQPDVPPPVTNTQSSR